MCVRTTRLREVPFFPSIVVLVPKRQSGKLTPARICAYPSTHPARTTAHTYANAQRANAPMHADQGKQRYELQSVVFHAGVSFQSGHYYCCAREYTEDDNKQQQVSSISGNAQTDDGIQSARSVPHSSSSGGNDHRAEGVSSTAHSWPESMTSSSSSFSSSNSPQVPWLMFNDSHVTRLRFADVQGMQRRFRSDTPYMLFYSLVGEERGSFDVTMSVHPLVRKLAMRAPGVV